MKDYIEIEVHIADNDPCGHLDFLLPVYEAHYIRLLEQLSTEQTHLYTYTISHQIR